MHEGLDEHRLEGLLGAYPSHQTISLNPQVQPSFSKDSVASEEMLRQIDYFSKE
jgi:hypothetical protein